MKFVLFSLAGAASFLLLVWIVAKVCTAGRRMLGSSESEGAR